MDNKDFEKNSIDDILKEFQAKKDSREKSDYVPVNVEPPKPRADFAKAESEEPKPDKEVNKPKIELKKIDFSPLKSDKAKGVYKYLIINICNSLHSELPFMFEKISDYSELLFPESLLEK